MKLTRNKRHFYQRGRASCNLASSKVPSYIFHPPRIINPFLAIITTLHNKYYLKLLKITALIQR